MPDALKNTARQMARLIALTIILATPLFAIAQLPQKSGLPRAQKHEGRHEIDQLEDAWRTAVLKSDTTAMSSLLADDFMGISPSGTLQNKDQLLAAMGSGRIHISSLELSDRKVRFYGATALVTSLATVNAAGSEGGISGSFRYTRVYVRNDQKQWKVVSFEASRIRNSGERH
jgi:ketosteroid isomerase-like protein